MERQYSQVTLHTAEQFRAPATEQTPRVQRLALTSSVTLGKLLNLSEIVSVNCPIWLF